MLPEYIISKFKSRIGSLYSPHSRSQYLHSRRRYYNSIPLLSIVALLGNVDHDDRIQPNRNSANAKTEISPHSNPTHLEYYEATPPYDFARDVSLSPVVTGFAHCMLARKLRTPFAKHIGVVASTFLLLSCSILLNMIMSNSSCYATQETFGDSTASMTLDTSNVEVKVAPGETGYASKNISLSISNVKDYTLTITAPASLSKESTSGDTNSTATSWGYAYGQSGKVEDMTYTNFTGATQILESGNTDTISNKTLALAASFDNNNDAGHYTAEVTLALTATPRGIVKYTLTYDANGGSGAPASQTCKTEEGTVCNIIISSTEPTLANNTLLGWSTNKDSHTADYTSGGSITISSDTTLYAVWQWDGTLTPGFTSITNMQQMTSTICSNAVVGAYKDLKDTRDSNTYRVVKFSDGRCWMTEDLRLMGSRTLTSADSDVTSNYTIPASSAAGFSSNTASNAYLSGSTGYYTWCAATAGTCTSATTDGANASSSICPKGWKLPTGRIVGDNTVNDFYNLFYSMNLSVKNKLSAISTSGTGLSADDLTIVQGSPYNFTYTGRMWSGDMGLTTYGYWWSRTANSNTYAYNLRINGNNDAVFPGTVGYTRSLGYAVRCIAQ